ncbi:MAG TPA: sulfurtransferase [Thermoleophilaceae bacterium]|jgi:thiosulfate/3-mercaptopyruvate sulfurtransferase
MAGPPLVVSPEWLAEHLEDPTLRVLDATVRLRRDENGTVASIESGRPAFDAGHVPGAAFVDMIELSDRDAPAPFMLPRAEVLAEAMASLGVGEGTHVVAYDTVGGMWAARLWWTLRAYGFEAASVLDGGLRAWREGGRPVSTDAPPPRDAGGFEPRFRPELVATREQVEEQVDGRGGGGACLVNALEPAVFRGEVSLLGGRPGRIPGSVNVPTSDLVDPDTGRFLPPERIRERFAAAGALDGERVVTYCGAGIAASMDAFALALAGRDDAAVYDGSLAEWASDPERPLETG